VAEPTRPIDLAWDSRVGLVRRDSGDFVLIPVIRMATIDFIFYSTNARALQRT
jgi:hypothetical protein